MRLTIGLGAAAAFLLAQAAVAAPVDYDCDTPTGSFSQLIQTQAGPAYHVLATLTPLQWRDGFGSAGSRLPRAGGSRCG